MIISPKQYNKKKRMEISDSSYTQPYPQLPPGFRFPTDEELIKFITLIRKPPPPLFLSQ